MATERIQKVLAAAGIASRRKAEQLVAQGRVTVNGEVVCTPGTKVDARKDKILVDGTAIARQRTPRYTYVLLHKPRAVISSTDDDRGRPTVIDLVPEFAGKRLVLAGRLDYHSEGLVLLTDDGDLVYELTHPSHGTPKVYQVKIKGEPTEAQLEKLRRGVYLEDGPTRPAHVESLGLARSNTWVEITLTEGRNRQVRRMFDVIGHRVQRLVRVGLAGLSIEGLDVGESRLLTETEVAALKSGEVPSPRVRRSNKGKKKPGLVDRRTRGRAGAPEKAVDRSRPKASASKRVGRADKGAPKTQTRRDESSRGDGKRGSREQGRRGGSGRQGGSVSSRPGEGSGRARVARRPRSR